MVLQKANQVTCATAKEHIIYAAEADELLRTERVRLVQQGPQDDENLGVGVDHPVHQRRYPGREYLACVAAGLERGFVFGFLGNIAHNGIDQLQ